MTTLPLQVTARLGPDGALLDAQEARVIGVWKLVVSWKAGLSEGGKFSGTDHVRAQLGGRIYVGRVGVGKAGTGVSVRLNHARWLCWDDPCRATKGRVKKGEA
jgi:hypothetical protein